ncbi:S41 family peptidase, partial [Xanthovirga aplysinae]|uniref:S41 family peptidase n=1 Tax=Xanthovirga aplysinae TaxID=2529853 RepID=UPI0012BD196B
VFMGKIGYNMKFKLFIILIALFIASCKEKIQENNSINGVWQSVGSGWMLHIEDSSSYSLFDVTSISCLPRRKAELREILESLALKDDTLSYLKGVITYKFTKAEGLPKLCGTELKEETQKDPIYNFEVFSETVKDHYAFMELNSVNWPKLFQQQKDKLSKHSTDLELYSVIEETLEKLNDNHAYLEANDEVYEALEQKHLDQEEEARDDENLREFGDFTIAKMVAKHHLEEEMTKDSWLIQWGKLKEKVGYIQIKAMWLYADLDVPDSLIEELGYVDAYVKTLQKLYEGDYIEKEVEGVKKTMDKIMDDLADMNSIIIDLRFNGGGQDAVSFEILRRFVTQKQKIATQKLKYGNQFSPTLPLYINGTTKAYSKPVYLLTSQQTGSAAEAFAIATMSMKNIKRIGSPTSGAMSTALEKILPNGWAFSISNEVYMDVQGNGYENKGIPVDYDLRYPYDRQTFFRAVANDLEADKQSILKAMDILRAE